MSRIFALLFKSGGKLVIIVYSIVQVSCYRIAIGPTTRNTIPLMLNSSHYDTSRSEGYKLWYTIRNFLFILPGLTSRLRLCSGKRSPAHKLEDKEEETPVGIGN